MSALGKTGAGQEETGDALPVKHAPRMTDDKRHGDSLCELDIQSYVGERHSAVDCAVRLLSGASGVGDPAARCAMLISTPAAAASTSSCVMFVQRGGREVRVTRGAGGGGGGGGGGQGGKTLIRRTKPRPRTYRIQVPSASAVRGTTCQARSADPCARQCERVSAGIRKHKGTWALAHRGRTAGMRHWYSQGTPPVEAGLRRGRADDDMGPQSIPPTVRFRRESISGVQ
ncbi:unnamed protein product [Mycena citricolor]|uniref:Uncharacterized protein n=1 Tax=Mycena citricolor TaxID=2018698 RepID=A0AAD2HQA3_9AGAR|nr:unnamed protein product [Mycena citricolor]